MKSSSIIEGNVSTRAVVYRLARPMLFAYFLPLFFFFLLLGFIDGLAPCIACVLTVVHYLPPRTTFPPDVFSVINSMFSLDLLFSRRGRYEFLHRRAALRPCFAHRTHPPLLTSARLFRFLNIISTRFFSISSVFPGSFLSCWCSVPLFLFVLRAT